MMPLDDFEIFIINSLRTGNILRIKDSLNRLPEKVTSNLFKSTSGKEFKRRIERILYKELSKCLESERFEDFKELVDLFVKFDIFFEVRKIQNRLRIISQLLLICIEEVATGYQTSFLGKILDILRFFNEYNLFDMDLDENELKIVEKIRKDDLFIANISDLFGKVTNSFILYLKKVMPQALHDYFVGETMLYYMDTEQLAFYIKNIFFNQYTIYGLSVKYLSSIKKFIREFKKSYLTYKSQTEKINNENNTTEIEMFHKSISYYFGSDIIEHTETKKHLISPENILKIMDKILTKDNYNFYSISMVFLGGLGPQGYGLTYSTPKGEIVEICSDTKESEAIIIEFKKFQKQQFLHNLEKEMIKLKITVNIIQKILNYLSKIINKEEIISYPKKEPIINKIRYFLNEDQEYQNNFNEKIYELIEKISNAITIILVKIKLEDQFKARMDLVSKGKLKPEDIAKLTSLKEKSHYDVLRERLFYQYIVDWFYEIYLSEKTKKQN